MLDTNGFLISKEGRRQTKLSALVRLNLKPIVFMTEAELMAVPTGDIWVFDTECYSNFWYCAFKHLKSGKYVAFEQSPDCQFNSSKLNWMLWRYCIVGFNSLSYDMPMIALAIKGASCEKLKEASDFIIKSGLNWGTKKVTTFDFERQYKLKVEKYNHIDLFNVCPVNGGLTATPASLKLYSGRLHSPRMQDLPFPETHILTADDAAIVRPYCCNDLDNTELLFNELLPEIQLRIEMSDEYGVDLRSKSDAQIAEAVVNSELQKVLGYWPQKPTIAADTVLQYNVPSFIKFESPQLNAILEQIANARFELDALGSPIWPKGLGEPEKVKKGEVTYVLKARIGQSVYKLGMGGLHSTEESVSHFATDEIEIDDDDVESFYPRTILNQMLYPKHLGEAFMRVYEKIVNTRIHAKEQAKVCKKAGDRTAAKKWKTIADSLKIVINGLFGKFGNKYSTVYAPQLMLQVTITGQLVLLMLIERLEKAGIPIVSGNTDGVVSKYHKRLKETKAAVIKQWEAETGYKTENTKYKSIHSRDVNSYCAVKFEGDAEARFLDEQLGVKTKGAYCERGSALNSILSKNPETLICSDAVVRLLANGTSIEKTIRQCTDIRRFTAIKNVKGGGEKNGVYLGKVARWYYPKGETEHIAYVGSGNKVGKTDGARPLMDLPDEFPNDINYDWYINEAIEMLHDCGYYKKPTTEQLAFF